MAAALPRPGTVLGAYPERRRDAPARGQHAPSRWAQASAPCRPDTFLKLVNDADARLAQQPDVDAATLRDLRERLRRVGLMPDACALAFAIIRRVSQQVLGLRHHDCQLLGGLALVNGRCAEMATGEGKTATAPLAAATAALAGCPVHVVTANDYLARRDGDAMRPLYAALGLSVGVVTSQTPAERRREAYACDVTYCSDKQLVFDYLHDSLTRAETRSDLLLRLERVHARSPRMGRLRLRGLCFAIVDEADSVLIDQARTPLILSRATPGAVAPQCYAQALALASKLREHRDFRLAPRTLSVFLSARGEREIEALADQGEYDFENRRERERMVAVALKALHLYRRDHHYLVSANGVEIIDSDTGRTLPDRRWEGGLHQMIEVKEGHAPSAENATVARITYQEFFARYLRLAGMTGTAREVARELRQVYGLRVTRIAPHRPLRREEGPVKVFARTADKHAAIGERVLRATADARPVLVGTRSVAASEAIAAVLHARGAACQVLNARQDASEAQIVARAGTPGRVTVSTNMAGRGTDIVLAPAATDAGGLHVIVAEPNEARRIDRQLVGRCARQGDPGSAEYLVCLEDELIACYLPTALRRILAALTPPGGHLPAWLGRVTIALAQRRAERQAAAARRALRGATARSAGRLAFAGRAA